MDTSAAVLASLHVEGEWFDGAEGVKVGVRLKLVHATGERAFLPRGLEIQKLLTLESDEEELKEHFEEISEANPRPRRKS